MSTNPPPPPSGDHMTGSPGLLPIPFNAAPPVMPDAGMGMGFPSSMMMGDEPFAKKQRMDVTNGLIPEQEFIALYPVRVISLYVLCSTSTVCMYVCVCSATNKNQNLASRFHEDRIFYRLLIAVPLKMYRKFGHQNGFWLVKC